MSNILTDSKIDYVKIALNNFEHKKNEILKKALFCNEHNFTVEQSVLMREHGILSDICVELSCAIDKNAGKL